jgi:cation:H+ antiporter
MQELTTFLQNDTVGFVYCLLLLAFGILLLVIGGDLLVTHGLNLARHLNIKTFVVGLTIIAFSTSSPELAFNVFAASSGHGEVTIGNIFGSNLANLALVLGIGAIVHNSVRRKSGEQQPAVIPRRILVIEGRWIVGATIGITLLTLAILRWGNTDGYWFNFNRPIGIVLLLCFGIFLWAALFRKKNKLKPNVVEKVAIEEGAIHSLPKTMFMLLAGLLLLILGGKSAEIGAVEGARWLNISEMFIGVTIVAIATSLPEVVTTIIAAKKGEVGLIWGNILGSNIFNILFVLPITILVASFVLPPEARVIPIDNVVEPIVYMFFMCLFTVVVYRMMRKDSDINDFEGWTMVVAYAFFLIGITIWKTMFIAPV